MSAHRRGLAAALIGSVALVGCAPDISSRGAALFDMATPPSTGPKVAAVPKPPEVPKTFAPNVATPTKYQDAATWKHLPQPVSAEQFSQDKANCTKMGNSAPGAGSPEMKFFLVYTQCMRSSGYAPN
jgi:hypothetical protein